MKTYCKPAKVDVENTEFNIPAVRKAFDGKYKRRDFQRLLLNTGLVTEQELAQEFLDGTKQKIYTATDAIAEELTRRIRKKKFEIAPNSPVPARRWIDSQAQKYMPGISGSADNGIHSGLLIRGIVPCKVTADSIRKHSRKRAAGRQTENRKDFKA